LIASIDNVERHSRDASGLLTTHAVDGLIDHLIEIKKCVLEWSVTLIAELLIIHASNKKSSERLRMSSTLHQPHDAFFRKSMSDLRVAKDFFLQHLPHSLQAQIDWEHLKLQNASFLDEHLKRSAADMLYQVTLNQKPAYLYLLCEHTSSPDPQLPFRIIRYMVRIIQQHSEQTPGDPLPAVYPLVLYTGSQPYTAALNWYALFGEQHALMHQVFNSPLPLIEVCKIEDPV